MRPILILIAAFMLTASAQGYSLLPDQLSSSAQIDRALKYIKAIEPETLDEQARICEIAAPPFKERESALYFRRRFEELGLKNVRIDGAGNAIGERPGASDGPVVVLAAHLDTVFPEGTPVKVMRDEAMLKGPGIGDNCRGLAVMLAIIRALNETGITTSGTIIFVADVGEEGLGDLRGVRHLFNEELKGKIDYFIAIDGAGLEITNRAVGSHRYRVTFRGPGGHSFGAFGMPNPIHALGRAIEKVSRFKAPDRPKTTFNVGRIEGGTSVNSIAHTVWMEVDMRSESAVELNKLDAQFKEAVRAALDEENRFWESPHKLTVDVELIGDRPTGEQATDAPIVKAALEADAQLGIKSRLTSGSTDSNIPISLGIPAITIDGGGRGRGAHSLAESFDSTDSHLGAQRALLVTLNVSNLKL
ncbi:MAG: M20/M25/M40 family metallo-hydrolase [Blastocatellia bacterium]|nr:M20/M25/M40 family metallo-hydrolase [Blastocatellia bacterium]